MIVVTGTAKVKGEHRDEAMVHIRKLLDATRQESGCLAYMWGVDLDDPNQLVIYERWEDQAAQTAHGSTPHFAEFLANVGPLMAGAGLILHDVSKNTTLM